jgi:aerobic C4-dicarboxylate transport protein
MTPQPLYKSLFAQVLAAIAVGILLGYLAPEQAVAMRPLGDGFIKLIRMMIAPVVFTTVVVGIAQMGAMKDVGRIGFRALVYFEVVSTLALVIGLIVVTVLKPGRGLTMSAAALDVKAVAAYATASQSLSTTDFLLNIIPNTVVDAFARGEVLQVLLFSVLFGLALLTLGRPVRPIVTLLEHVSHALFAVIDMLMRLAPIGAFGGMAFTIGRHGIGSLVSLGQLMLAMYGTCALFICVVLGAIARLAGFSLWKLLRYIREEILIVAGTASSETLLPRLMEKMERLGCRRSVVGFVVPTGYSFNLDGTAIYMTMATVFTLR